MGTPRWAICAVAMAAVLTAGCDHGPLTDADRETMTCPRLAEIVADRDNEVLAVSSEIGSRTGDHYTPGELRCAARIDLTTGRCTGADIYLRRSVDDAQWLAGYDCSGVK